MAAGRLSYHLEALLGRDVLRAFCQLIRGHSAIDTIDYGPNGRRRSIGPAIRVLLILILIHSALRHQMLRQVFLLRCRVTDSQMILGLTESILLVSCGDS